MKRCLCLLMTVSLLSGCGNKAEKDFMRGCMQGSGGSKKECSCIYNKMEKTYGTEKLEAINTMGSLPPSYAENLLIFAEQCTR